MKNILLWLLLISVFAPFGAIAQTIISAEKNNIVYIGLDNPIAVAVPGYPSRSVFAIIDSGGTWTLDKPGHYILRPDGSKRFIKVTVSVKNFWGKKRKMGDMTFKVKVFPPPLIMLGVFEPGPISKQELSSAKFIQANLVDFCICGLSPRIIETQIIIISADSSQSKPQIKTFKGKLIPEDILNDFNNTNNGDVIYIFSKIKDMDGLIKNLTSVYTIK